MKNNIGLLLSKRALINPDREAFVDSKSGLRLTFEQLNNRCNSLANALVKLGIEPGDRVALALMNSVEFLEAYFAVAKIGGIVVPLNWRLVSDELEFILKDSGLANLSIAGMAKVNLNNAGGKEQAAIGQLIAAMSGKTVCVQSSTIHQNFLEKHMAGAVETRLYQTVDDHNLDLATGRCDAILADVGSIIDFMEAGGGVDVAFTGPTFSGGVFGDGVGGAVRKEDTDILEMWNKVIADMSADGTTAKITQKWFGRDISM